MSDDGWAERLRIASAGSLRRRAARADARRAAAERRRHGVTARLAWRQIRCDARAADHGRPSSGEPSGPPP